MTVPAGYAFTNDYLTPYGNANYWIMTDFHFTLDTIAGITALNITLSGYPSLDDANNQAMPMGQYSFSMSPDDIQAMSVSALPIALVAIQKSSPAWINAAYILPTPPPS